MDHIEKYLLDLYAHGLITDDGELARIDDHLLECEQCQRRAMAADLLHSGGLEALSLHIAAGGDETSVALCGDNGARNIISKALVRGINPAVICPECLQSLHEQADQKPQRVN